MEKLGNYLLVKVIMLLMMVWVVYQNLCYLFTLYKYHDYISLGMFIFITLFYCVMLLCGVVFGLYWALRIFSKKFNKMIYDKQN